MAATFKDRKTFALDAGLSWEGWLSWRLTQEVPEPLDTMDYDYWPYIEEFDDGLCVECRVATKSKVGNLEIWEWLVKHGRQREKDAQKSTFGALPFVKIKLQPEPLNHTWDERILFLYGKQKRSSRRIPYTPEFDRIHYLLNKEGCPFTKNELLRSLLWLQKQGLLPEKGKQ